MCRFHVAFDLRAAFFLASRRVYGVGRFWYRYLIFFLYADGGRSGRNMELCWVLCRAALL